MLAKSETDIRRNWGADASTPKASICCIAFNHMDFIEQSIDSLLMQETEFPFEILIHDDASTDGTTEIIEQYAAMYPGIIRTVLQSENQYSKVPIISPRFLFPLVRGQYVAMCEGDDYWTSPHKLAVQCSAMDRRPQVNLSFHPVHELNALNQKTRTIARVSRSQREVSSQVVILGGGGYCPTPSVVFRSTVIPQIIACVENAPLTDKFLQIVACLKGGALFLPEVMSVYRVGHKGAWTGFINDSKLLQQYRARIRNPYVWLYTHCPDRLTSLLMFSEADQYSRIAKNYLIANDVAGAQGAIAESTALFPDSRALAGVVQWFAKGATRTRIYILIYPAIRAFYRYRTKLLSRFRTHDK